MTEMILWPWGPWDGAVAPSGQVWLSAELEVFEDAVKVGKHHQVELSLIPSGRASRAPLAPR
jgi:hypothetical protein